MKTVKTNISIESLLLWTAVIIAGYFGILHFDLPAWLAGVVPIHLLVQILMIKSTKYVISDNELLISRPFEKIPIKLDQIRSYSIQKTNLIKRFITGFPKEVVLLNYNKYDAIELLSTDPELIKSLWKPSKE